MSTILRLRAKRIAVSLSFASVLAVPAIARADEAKADCEPGSWFCGEPAPSEKELQPLPAAEPAVEPPPTPPKIVYEAPPPEVTGPARDAPPAYRYVPRRPPPKREWGLNLHLGGTMMGRGRDGNAGMALAGLGLRFRPIPQAAIEADLDFAGGRDYHGFRRSETGFTLNGLIFLNPKDTAQVYLVGGFGWSGAHAIDDRDGYDKMEYEYGYFGLQTGIGLELRVSRVVALNVDLRGLIRGRVDDNRRTHPEFVSASGKATNTSGGGLFRGGLTFYW